MELTNFTFIVTDDCNFNCSYCFQKKEKKYIELSTIDHAIKFFYDYLSTKSTVMIGFYGGEPLLAYPQIKHATVKLKRKNNFATEPKNLDFQVTTNGSLLTDEMLTFFDRHKFLLTLSFDGLAQDKGRKKNSLWEMIRMMKHIGTYPNIRFEINSVFTPQTVGLFADSIRYMIENGSPNITFNFSSMEEWSDTNLELVDEQLNKLSQFLQTHHRKTGKIPVTNFQSRGDQPEKRPKPGTSEFRCDAGTRHMAITPAGELWGCFLFHDYFKNRGHDPQFQDYSFGPIDKFIAEFDLTFPPKSPIYKELRQDYFQVEGEFCFLCKNLDTCMVCPVNAAYSSGSIGKISLKQCKLTKIQAKAKHQFLSSK